MKGILMTQITLKDVVDWSNEWIVQCYEDSSDLSPFSTEDINAKDERGMTMLMHCCDQGMIDYTKCLLDDKRLDIFSKSNEGYNALVYACIAEYINEDLIKTILEFEDMIIAEEMLKQYKEAMYETYNDLNQPSMLKKVPTKTRLKKVPTKTSDKSHDH